MSKPVKAQHEPHVKQAASSSQDELSPEELEAVGGGALGGSVSASNFLLSLASSYTGYVSGFESGGSNTANPGNVPSGSLSPTGSNPLK